ncbi:metallo-beta-lactamase superfamily protein (macronuclear) [Tetrahymena thermophila SB210]|uniref:hydroxyacylglutathione hydrolase n=1 Tax=Tetrahymena thermophila (strain SB210) TaxID=312017 RepID=Q23CX3_TETTS|nr:metallo-beta-lactamase superfamily protein [Tetrahymena thermophila SB210]EAR94499.1 metallo-beta-lactamase superfamily protein [Tetrahymena thermophila SB210]|eukprot:XP_001014913.1 metallo-beta-lactamase superfamily protein [Tetrahymena thermophila SB210]
MIQNQLFKVISIPLFNDNYSYALFSAKQYAEKQTGVKSKIPCYLVDPADSQKILQFLDVFPDLQVSRILYTHKHWDHIGNPQQLLDQLKQNARLMEDYRVIASKLDGSHIPTLTHSVFDNPNDKETKNETSIEGEFQIDFLYVPCHTTGHVLYHFKPHNKTISTEESVNFERQEVTGYNLYSVDECLFTGDTLFIGGCGRFFEGNAAQMLSNMDKISSIQNKNIKIFCGHEYTKSNLEWSSQVEQNNEVLKQWYQEVLQMTSSGIQTIPSTLQKELQTNVFMRCRTQNLQEIFQRDPTQIMETLRAMKNSNIIDIPQNMNL